MLDRTQILELLSGRQLGWKASAWRCLLAAGEVPYRWAVQLRNARYHHRPRLARRVGTPVLSVGNITTGGTGKTPLVAWLANRLIEQNVRVALVSRGYRATAAGVNDEALELARQLPSVVHLQNPDRVAAARQAIQDHQAQLILLDDGFQHRRIHRDLDLVLVDALQPWGYGHLLPRGLLREPLDQLARADIVAVSRADAVSDERLREITADLRRWAPRADLLLLAHRPAAMVNATGDHQPLESLRNQPVAALCAIGNPAGFRHTLESLGCQLVGWREFPDHHHFTEHDAHTLGRWLESLPTATRVLCTLKDLVKLKTLQIAGRPLWAIAIEIGVIQGLDQLNTRLDQLVHQVASQPGIE